MVAYKAVAVILAYAALWDALGRWRVPPRARRVQLSVYGLIALLYVFMVVFTGGTSTSPGALLLPTSFFVDNMLIQVYFAGLAAFLVLTGSIEVGIGLAFYDPSLPMLSRAWVRTMFDGPVWRLLASRHPGMPFAPDEYEASVRHTISGVFSLMVAVWSLQVATDLMGWGRFDPVALLILVKAINIWMDARIWNKVERPEMVIQPGASYPVTG